MALQSGNIVFLWDNPDLAEATLAVVPPEAENTDWPVTNLADTFRSVAAKFSQGAMVKIDFGRPVYASAAALVDLVCSPETTVIITAYSDAFITPIVTHEFMAGQPMLIAGEGVLGDGIAGGYTDDDDLYGKQPHTKMIDTDDYAYQYWSIDVAAAGEWHLGRLILGDYFQPQHNISWSWAHAPHDMTTNDITPGGVIISDVGPQRNGVVFALGQLTPDEAFGPLIKISRAVGKKRDMVLVLAPEDVTIRPLTTLYRRFETDIRTSNPNLNWHKTGEIVFRENL